MPSKEFGQRLREQRKLQHYTIEQLADKLNITAHYLGDIERGLKYPSFDTFILLVNTLEVRADYFLRDVANPSAEVFRHDLLQKIKDLPPEKQRAATDIFEAVLKNLEKLD